MVPTSHGSKRVEIETRSRSRVPPPEQTQRTSYTHTHNAHRHNLSMATASSLLSLCRSASSSARLLFEQPGLARLLRPSSSTNAAGDGDTLAARAEAEAALGEVRALVAAGSALLAAVEADAGAKRPRALALVGGSGSGTRERVLMDPNLLEEILEWVSDEVCDRSTIAVVSKLWGETARWPSFWQGLKDKLPYDRSDLQDPFACVMNYGRAISLSPVLYREAWLRDIRPSFEIWDAESSTCLVSACGTATVVDGRLRIRAFDDFHSLFDRVSAAGLDLYDGASSMVGLLDGLEGKHNLAARVTVKHGKTGKMALLYHTELGEIEASMVDPNKDDGIPYTPNEMLLVQESYYELVSCPRFSCPANDDGPCKLRCRLGFSWKSCRIRRKSQRVGRSGGLWGKRPTRKGGFLSSSWTSEIRMRRRWRTSFTYCSTPRPEKKRQTPASSVA